MPDSLIQNLTDSFLRFPGIGPRQARRFVYYLLHATPATIDKLVQQIEELKRSATRCADCGRYYPSATTKPKNKVCEICRDSNRDVALLMVVEKDIDLENVLRTGTYQGQFFVLGSLIKIMDKQSEISMRSKDLLNLVEKKIKTGGLQEVIAALAANQDGDMTTEFIKKSLTPLLTKNKIKFSTLGRGLSTGVELEYSDSETLKNALRNRR